MAGQTTIYLIDTWDDADLVQGVTDADSVEALADLDGNNVSIDCSAGGTLTLDTEDATAWNRFRTIRLTGSPGAGFTLDLPNRKGTKIVMNESGQTATLDTVTGSTLKPTLATGNGQWFTNYGTELHLASGTFSHS